MTKPKKEELESDIRKLLIEYHKTIDSNESLRIAATESMRIVERKNMALMKCRRQIAHLNSLLSNSIMGKLKYDRQFGYWNDKIMDEKFKPNNQTAEEAKEQQNGRRKIYNRA